MKHYILFFYFFTFHVVNPISGQDSLALLGLLKDEGFQNIRLTRLGPDGWRIDLENRQYRYTPFAMQQLFRTLNYTDSELHFILREKDIPMAHMMRDKNESWTADWDSQWLDVNVGKAIKGTESFFQFDIPIGIGMRYTIGNFIDNHVAVVFDLLTGVQTTLAKGLTFHGTVALPVYNNYDSKKKFRLNNLMLIQDLRFSGNWFLSTSLGIFHRNRVGVYVKSKKNFGEGRFALGLLAAYTDYTGLTGENIELRFFGGPPSIRYDVKENEGRPINFFVIRADYLWKKYDLLVELHIGKFYNAGYGSAIRIFRQFNEKRFGVEFRQTETGSDGGFFIRWPLFPKKYMKPGKVRITGMPFLETNYSYDRFGYVDRFYQVSNTLIDGLWEYWPSILNDPD